MNTDKTYTIVDNGLSYSGHELWFVNAPNHLISEYLKQAKANREYPRHNYPFVVCEVQVNEMSEHLVTMSFDRFKEIIDEW